MLLVHDGSHGSLGPLIRSGTERTTFTDQTGQALDTYAETPHRAMWTRFSFPSPKKNNTTIHRELRFSG
jgi:hypothetical protein